MPVRAPSTATSLEEAIEQLRDSETRFRSMFEDAAVGMAHVDPTSGRLLEVNDSLCGMLGFSREELLASRWQELTVAEDLEDSAAAQRDLRAHDARSYTLRKRYRKKDGSIVWARISVSRGITRSSSRSPLDLAIVEDVTAQHKAEERSRELSAQLSTLLRVSRTAMVVTSLVSDRILEANDAFAEVFGWPREEAIGRTTAELGIYLEPLDRQRVLEDLRSRTVAPARELQARTRLGEERIVLCSVGAADIGGEPCAIGVLHDVTALRHADRAVLESQTQLRAMFDEAAVGIGITDAITGRFVHVNPAFCAMLGYSREELLTRGARELTHPQDLPTTEAALRDLQEGRSRALTNEKRYVRKDGRPFWARTTVSTVLSGSGQVESFIGVVEDITARREAEEIGRLQTSALEATDDGILITDDHEKIEWTNAAVTRLTGYSREELVGTNASRFGAREGHENTTSRPIVETFRAGRVWRGRFVARRKDGSTYTEELSITPVVDERGVVTHSVAVKRDVSDRERSELALRESEKEMRAAQKMEAVGRLAGGIAHDFNNLLSVILAYTESAIDQLHGQDPLQGDLKEISDAALRAVTLTRQLLAFSRRQVLDVERVDLDALVDGVTRMLRRVIGENIALTIQRGAALAPVRADRGQLEQVIMNLVVNSRDAMPSGGEIVIGTTHAVVGPEKAAALGLEPGVHVQLEVADDGLGMDECTRARVFEPFFTTKAVGKGTGLGLSTVYGIVKQSHGAIEVESTVGGGTRFRIYLPQDTAAGDERISRSSAPRVSGGGHERILVVEDEPALRNVIAKSLREAGYRVLTAESAEEATRVLLLEGSGVDLLLTDVIMPGEGGPALAERVRAEAPETRVLFMSGYADAFEQDGIDGANLLSKPFDRKTLRARVRNMLDDAPPRPSLLPPD